MLRFNDIADRVLEYDSECDLELLQRAYVFTAKVHEGQERLSGEPYLIHPLEVAGILVDMRLDEVTIVAGLLHDTVEDTLASLEEIERLFGDEVAFLVEGLTKISKVQFRSARARQAENFRKMLVAMSKDIRILLIKLADRIHNMRTLHFMPRAKAQVIAQETLEIYVPLAHRLGIDWMKRELADLAFRTLHPDVVVEFERMLRGRSDERERYIEEVKGIMARALEEADLSGVVSGRLKDMASIHAKMADQGLSLDQIYDVIAFRIVLDGGTEQVYAALGLVHSTWPPVPGRFKDYVALPKANGYKALHTTVIGPYGERIEVQLRTEEMHLHAEMGIAAHWRYKGHGGREQDDENFNWLRQLLERQQELDDPHEFLDTVKVDLFADEVFIFTPNGDVINLPRGSTALDFAYAIHSEVGDHCSGAKVSGTMRPLSRELESGDTVEVMTNPNQSPKKDWLEFVVSGKAKSRIRHAVRLAENERSRELGRGILERELRKSGVSLARVLETDEMEPVVARYVKGGVEDLFAAVGYGRVSARAVLEMLRPDLSTPPVEEVTKGRKLRDLFRRERKTGGSGIRVDGHGDVLVRFGQCCSPLPGDEIIGFVTRGRGVTIHSRECRVAFELDKERCIDVEWEEASDIKRRIRIKVTSRDAPGLLAKVTKTISAAGINIGSARIDTHDDTTATQTFDLWVGDVATLREMMKDIQKVKGVLVVERVRS
ncbi:MAG: bifunctional (p)ppGpp synthetase/guanosine-3',5'-bis(diphosphate) 3'-pyrophosphohydrolase [Deltaproteobacteria bacterium]|nr:bifunctional (p)ppGpp synthetase/guanosine-3',5'-bis(diphosphate) 3'-pyrophosphohydrolase [Deltaproteobacteria bacterium]MBW2392952.1 bifunctional (p)ppGpp synthetase/guanosine-3',5'-bis(diphosphate) 3'-pyrophosphohydrolase [Deltaproteobacteria bacterium]